MGQILDNLKLPDRLPTPEAIKSGGQNLHSYEPEFWEFQYDIHRYLERIDDLALERRYDEVSRNLEAIVTSDRHIIPINTFLSSWYWYRKEHQTRYEFKKRGMTFDRKLPVPALVDLASAPLRPRLPNAGDVLFKYGKRKYLADLIRHGQLRVSSAAYYADLEDDPARRDEELVKHEFRPGRYTKVTTMDGREIPIIGDLKHIVGGPDYFVQCMACDWDPRLFDDFQADCCVVIRDVPEFSRRLQAAAGDDLAEWYFFDGTVEYFDPYEAYQHQYIMSGTSKDFRFAYQREYRFLWSANSMDLKATAFRDMILGPLEDIADLVDAPTRLGL